MLTYYKNKRVFLTGHTGFKGTWMTRMLLKAGAIVTGYSLAAPSPSLYELAGFEEFIKTGQLTSVIGDIRNLDALKKAMSDAAPQVVFHLAAQPIVRDSYKDPVYTYETNVMGTVHVMESIRCLLPLAGRKASGGRLICAGARRPGDAWFAPTGTKWRRSEAETGGAPAPDEGYTGKE